MKMTLSNSDMHFILAVCTRMKVLLKGFPNIATSGVCSHFTAFGSRTKFAIETITDRRVQNKRRDKHNNK